LRRLACIVVGLSFVTLAITNLAAQTPAAPQSIAAIHLGFDGVYKVGDWTPLWVDLVAGERPLQGRLEFTVLDGDGVEVTYETPASQRLDIPPGEKTTALTYVKFGRIRGELKVRLRDGERDVAERVFASDAFPAPLPASRELIVALGGDVGIADAARIMRRRPDEQIATATVVDLGRLPHEWRGYDSVDTLVVATGQGGLLENTSPVERRAIEQWVRLGGRIVLSVGANGETVFGSEGVLAALAPGRFLGVSPQRRTAGLESLINAGERIGAGEGRAGDLLMSVLADIRGTVVVAESAGPALRPILVEYPIGFGEATLLTVDLDREPLASWRDRPRLVRRLLEGSSERADQAEREAARGRVAHIGYEDLIGQLRAALDEFQGVALIAFSSVAALLVLYAVLIGPADYFLLRWWGRRMERTWLTFPLLVVIFCGLAWWGAVYFKSDRRLVNQVDLVDIDAESGLIRGALWAHIYSPNTQTFDIALTPRPPMPRASGDSGSLLTWQGLPGVGLGGMNSTAGTLFNAPYRLAVNDAGGSLRVEPRNMPIQIRATKGVAGRWWMQGESAAPGRVLTASTDGMLDGEVTNLLTVPIRDGWLAYNHWTYRLPQQLAPGQRVRLDRRLPEGNLVWRLTQKYVGEDYKEFSTPWDEASRDVPRIMEMMMWHQAAGGQSYTGLRHRYQAEIDLSAHLRTGRAVLVGRLDKPAAELSLNGEGDREEGSRHWAWCRIVFPVTQTD
jgi:hypothetical protein